MYNKTELDALIFTSTKKINMLRVLITMLLATTLWSAKAQTLTVWPGDANNDGIVNHIDVLYVGNAFTKQGIARDTLQSAWMATQVPPWVFVLPDNNINAGYTDCSGNGFVSVEDLLVIEENYGEINSNFNGSSFLVGTLNDPRLQVVIADSFWLPGDTVNFEIVLFQNPTDSVYGIAFTLHFDTLLANASNVSLNAHPQFGGGGRQPIFVSKNNVGAIEFGISRTNQINHGGTIAIASASMIIEDNLIGKAFLDVAQAFRISQVKMFDKQLMEKAVKGDTTEAKIITGLPEKLLQQKIEIYPIPTQGELQLKIEKGINLLSLKATSLNGSTFNLNVEPKQDITKINLNQLQNGIYILEVKTSQGIFHQKIKIER